MTKTKLTKKALVKGTQENKCKFTYLDEMLAEEKIINMIIYNTTDVTDCFSIINDSTFNKTRTVKARQRNPPTVLHKRAVSKKNSF